MKLYQLYSATTIVESNGIKILTDPWLVGNEYFGSWGMFPKYNFKKEKFNDINYIYISHIHPDHFSVRSIYPSTTISFLDIEFYRSMECTYCKTK